MTLRTVVMVLALVLVASVSPAQENEEEPLTERVSRLVTQLLEGTPDERLAAEKELSKLDPEALDPCYRELERLRQAERTLSRVVDRLGADLESQPGETHWVVEKYRLARSRFRQNDYLSALKILDAILTLEPQPAIRQKLIELRRRTRQMILQESLIAARLEPLDRITAPGESLLVRLKLVNNSEQALTLAVGSEDGWKFGNLVITYEAYTPAGEWLSRQFQRPIDLAADLELNPGQEWTRLVSLELDTELPEALVVLQRITVEGMLRPHHITRTKDGTKVGEFLPLLPERIFVAAPEAHSLLETPEAVIRPELEAMRRSEPPYVLDRARHRRLFYASLALPDEEQEELIETIILTLDRLPASSARKLMGLLSQLTHRFPEMEIEQWQKWWRNRR